MTTRAASQSLLVLLLVIGCKRGSPAGSATQQGSSDTEITFAVPDLSTPDRALKSYWAVKDSIEKNRWAYFARWREPWKATWNRGYSPVLEGDALAALTRPEPEDSMRLSREIVDVKMDTDTHATITARVRNVTPISPDAVLSAGDAERRRDGETYRYVLEKYQGGWKLVQVYSKYYSGDWQPFYTPTSTPGSYLFTSVSP